MKQRKRTIVFTLAGLFIALLHLVPFYILLTVSFKDMRDISSKWIFPGYLFTDNFVSAWHKAELGRAFMNTAFITFLSVSLIIILGSLAAFPLARYQTRTNKWMYGFFVSALIVPPLTILVPLYKMFVNLGFMNTYFGVVLLHVTFHLAMSIFLYTSFIGTIPKELDEASMIDGASKIGMFFRIILPLLKPVTATIIIMNANSIWNDYQFSVFFLQKPESKTITVALSTFFGENSVQIGWVAAGALMAAIPSIIIYIFLQRYFVEGITSGAIKG
ncbi:carbohydrate ABC transporter permease [Paenibacillus sp. BR2-3]|uniref:carbohydrate ABC transporter permease n=1 Tax=Paenibacillus sp. BR2-3 TaxID=3048494 RepID=UPI0039777F97